PADQLLWLPLRRRCTAALDAAEAALEETEVTGALVLGRESRSTGLKKWTALTQPLAAALALSIVQSALERIQAVEAESRRLENRHQGLRWRGPEEKQYPTVGGDSNQTHDEAWTLSNPLESRTWRDVQESLMSASASKRPREAIEGSYVDKKCPFTGGRSHPRRRIFTGVVTKMKRCSATSRDPQGLSALLMQKYQRLPEKRHTRTCSVHLSPCFRDVELEANIVTG
uniref:Ribosomal_S17_N domain-containing protein n=1 Tax=Macrostomum lignano TaxID=282301 RepID=A0A1I8FAM4_9PLAT